MFMMNKLVRTGILGIFFLFQPNIFAQVEEGEECFEPEDKSVQKLLKTAASTKSTKMERIAAFTDAVEQAGDNAHVYFLFADFNYQQALNVHSAFDQGRTNFEKLRTSYLSAETAYKQVIKICPTYHSDPYYKVGYINYLLGDKGQAAKYFKEFAAFDVRDPNKYSDSYSKNKSDVEEILPEMEWYDKFFNQPVPYSPQELTNVCTKKDEYLPMISPDNELIFFTRKGETDSPGIINPIIEEFVLSERDNYNSPFDKGTALRAPFNTNRFKNYGGVTMSLDNKEMFICACQEVDYQEHTNCDLYVTKFVRSGKGGNDFTWTELENLGPAVNTRDGWEAQPTLSADGNTLYFASIREGSRLTDIFYSERGSDGKWGTARALPGPINSDGHDKAPFIHQDSETMYFMSTCTPDRLGAGGTDVFFSRKDSTGNWGEPVNIGYPINSEGNEVAFVVSTDGHLAYYTSRNAGSNGYDIYYFELYEEARPQKVVLVKGEVKSETGEPVKDATVEVSYKGSEESVEVKVNGDDGKYAAIVKVEEDKDVVVTMKKRGYSFDTKLIKKREIEKIANSRDVVMRKIDMEIDPIKKGKAFTIDNILFDTDSYALLDDSKFVLDQFSKFLKENPTVTVTIQGHTDDRGDAAHNKELSANRAKACMDYIVSKGVATERLKSEGYGEDKPKVPNSSDENRALNRRTDFEITGL
jgi:outer membrane protein OmpA-like peptidoglycan-associated protein/tetratricopeptide (TPR) repeat protein